MPKFRATCPVCKYNENDINQNQDLTIYTTVASYCSHLKVHWKIANVKWRKCIFEDCNFDSCGHNDRAAQHISQEYMTRKKSLTPYVEWTCIHCNRKDAFKKTAVKHEKECRMVRKFD